MGFVVKHFRTLLCLRTVEYWVYTENNSLKTTLDLCNELSREMSLTVGALSFLRCPGSIDWMPLAKPGSKKVLYSSRHLIIIQETFLFKSLPSSSLSTLDVLIETKIGSWSGLQLSLSCAISFV